MNKININGWKRLWVLFSFVYLLMVIFLGFLAFPNEDVYRGWLSELFNCNGENIETTYERFLYENSKYSSLQLIDLLEQKIRINPQICIHFICKDTHNPFCGVIPRDPAKEIRDEYEGKLYLLKQQQLSFLKIYFLVWLIPVLSIYIIGWLSVWVYKGFKSNSY